MDSTLFLSWPLFRLRPNNPSEPTFLQKPHFLFAGASFSTRSHPLPPPLLSMEPFVWPLSLFTPELRGSPEIVFFFSFSMELTDLTTVFPSTNSFRTVSRCERFLCHSLLFFSASFSRIFCLLYFYGFVVTRGPLLITSDQGSPPFIDSFWGPNPLCPRFHFPKDFLKHGKLEVKFLSFPHLLLLVWSPSLTLFFLFPPTFFFPQSTRPRLLVAPARNQSSPLFPSVRFPGVFVQRLYNSKFSLSFFFLLFFFFRLVFGRSGPEGLSVTPSRSFSPSSPWFFSSRCFFF